MGRARAWVFTLNAWTATEAIALKSRLEGFPARYYVFGREVGSEGTPHLQGYVNFAVQVSFKKMKELIPRAHFERAKGTAQQNRVYCTKDLDFDEFGEIPLAGKRTDLADFRDAIRGGMNSRLELVEQFPDQVARFSRFMDLCIELYRAPPACPDITIYPWQVELIQVLKQPADSRHIHFVVDPTGGGGKSTFCSYVQAILEHVQILFPGKQSDIAHALSEDSRIFLFDIPRCDLEYVPYAVLEHLKDGRVFSPKYNSLVKLWRQSPHVVVMLNATPDMNKLSQDRYKIKNI